MAIDDKRREQNILDAAANLMIQHGYNKTTMSDVADAIGLSRALIYEHFKSKDDLLEALIAREMKKYGELWIEHVLADPKGGTVAGIHRGISYALKKSPFMTAIITRDEATFGRYLHKPDNIFAAMQTASMTRDLLFALQNAGTIRQGVNIPAMAYIMDVISYGLVEHRHTSTLDAMPPYDELMDTLAEMFDRMLTPEDGSKLEAGKEVLHRLADNARESFSKLNHTEERKMS